MSCCGRPLLLLAPLLLWAALLLFESLMLLAGLPSITRTCLLLQAPCCCRCPWSLCSFCYSCQPCCCKAFAAVGVPEVLLLFFFLSVNCFYSVAGTVADDLYILAFPYIGDATFCCSYCCFWNFCCCWHHCGCCVHCCCWGNCFWWRPFCWI